MAALSLASKGPNIILKRNPCDIFINPSNTEILQLWGGNIDLQYVINEIATVMYVCSYMTKGEKAMGETLKHVAKECQNDDIRTQMNKIKHEFLGKRVVGLPELVMHVLSMWFMLKSRKVILVNTNMKGECVSLPKPSYQLAQLDDDDENVFATSIIDRYAAQPHELQNMCLAEFATTYDPISSIDTMDMGIEAICPETRDDESIVGNGNMHNTSTIRSRRQTHEKIKLQNGLGFMCKRKRQAILHTKRYKEHTETEKYYHAKLLLYFPWVDEDMILRGHESYQEAYDAKCEIVAANAKRFNDDCDTFDLVPDDIHENAMLSVWDIAAPSISQDDAATQSSGYKTLQKIDNEKPTETIIQMDKSHKTQDPLLKLYTATVKHQHMSFGDYCKNMHSLNEEQKHIVMFNRLWCKDYIHALKTCK